MKHKHYEMIVAKAANMELVVFVKTCDSGAWYEKGDDSACQWWEDSDYFLCLPQHKEACLHWLNGGDVQEYSDVMGLCEQNWHEVSYSDAWSLRHQFMDGTQEIRALPKKEKRWIRIARGGLALDSMVLFESEEMARDRFNHQVVSIEVEV